MYRIRLESGEETVLQNVEDLLYGIGSGVIGPEAEIYHEKAEQWLPITVHPDYKRATDIIGGSPAQSAPTEPTPAVDPGDQAPGPRGSRSRRSSGSRRRTSKPWVPKAFENLPLLDVTLPEEADDREDHPVVEAGFDPNLEEPSDQPPAAVPPMARSARAPALDMEQLLGEPAPEVSELPPTPSPVSAKLEPTAMGDYDPPAPSVPSGDASLFDSPPSSQRSSGDQWLPDLAYPEMVSDPVPRRRGIVRARPTRQSWNRLGMVAAIIGIAILGWLGLSRFGAGAADGSSDTGTPDAVAQPELSEQQSGAAVSLDGEGLSRAAVTPAAVASPRATEPAGPGGVALASAEYTTAYASARSQFDSVMAGLDFTRMLAQSRFETESSLLGGMSTIRATMNAVQLYRSRELAIEAAHPGVDSRLRESPGAARAVDSVLTAVDAVYGLLLSQYGRYRFANGVVIFSNAAAEDEYGDARRRVIRHARVLAGHNRTNPTLIVQRVAEGLSGSSLPQLGTVVNAPRVPTVPKLDVEVTGPQWDSIEAERRARATDSILRAGMDVPWQTEEAPLR